MTFGRITSCNLLYSRDENYATVLQVGITFLNHVRRRRDVTVRVQNMYGIMYFVDNNGYGCCCFCLEQKVDAVINVRCLGFFLVVYFFG